MMSSLSTLVNSIKFQILVKQLDDDEFETFLSRLWRRNGKDTVLELFCRPQTGNNSISQMELIRISSAIITERDPSRRYPQPKIAIISRTPSQLIGEIASFLDYSDYVSFSSTNRKMFVDCNSPNRLIKLDLSKLTDIDPSFCLTNYPKLLYLGLHLEQTESLGISRDAITRHCPDLQALRLTAHRIDDRKEKAPTCSINDFITDNKDGCQTITTLRLVDFRKESALNSQQLIRLLTEFSALTDLQLWSMQCDDHCDVDELKLLCPLLHNITMAYVTGSGYAALMAAFSPKLRALMLKNCFRSSFQFPSNSDWSKLEQLSICGPTQNTINEIVNRAMNVRLLYFFPNVSERQKTARISNVQIENVVERMFADHPSLKDVCLETRGHLERICKSIHQGLSRIQKEKKDRLEITLLIDCSELTDMKGFLCLLSKILLNLRDSNIMHWEVQLVPFTRGRHFQPTTVEAIQSCIDSHDGMDLELKTEPIDRAIRIIGKMTM